MRIVITVNILVLIFACQVSASDLSKMIRDEGQICANGVIALDYDTIIKYTHPIILKMGGGEEKMKEITKNAMVEMKNQGVTVKSTEIGQPTLVKTIDGNIYAIVPQKITMKVPGGSLITNSYLLAVSEGETGRWYFIDTSPLNNENIGMLFPELKDQIEIPKKVQPAFISD